MDENNSDRVDSQDLRRLAVEAAVTAAYRDVFNPFIGWDEIKKSMAVIFPDHARLRYWFTEFRKFINNGGAATLPAKFPKYLEVQDELLVAINERINLSDDLTRISAMNFADRMYQSWRDFNPEVFIKPFKEHNGILVQISGLMGTGKTDFSLLITETLLKFDYVVVTNIKCKSASRIIQHELVPGEVPNLIVVYRMTDLLLKCIEMRRANRNVVIVWDEVSQWYHRQEAASRGNIDTSKFLRLIRKFSANIVFLEQVDEGLANVVNVMLAAKYRKIGRTKVHYSTRTLERNYNLWLESVPPTSLKFDTYDFAGFRPDVDFRHMFEAIEIETLDKEDAIEDYLMELIRLDNNPEEQPEPKQKKVKKVKKRRGPVPKLSLIKKEKQPVKGGV